ncbi:hypothetical protein KIPB_011133, partial [Kipferlia bialata]|eukprot:g11133.t1
MACMDSSLPVEAMEPVFARFQSYKAEAKPSDALRTAVQSIVAACATAAAITERDRKGKAGDMEAEESEADPSAAVITHLREVVDECSLLCGDGPGVTLMPVLSMYYRQTRLPGDLAIGAAADAGVGEGVKRSRPRQAAQIVLGGPEQPRDRALAQGLQVSSHCQLDHWFVCSLDKGVLTISGQTFKDRLYDSTLASLSLTDDTECDKIADVLFALAASCKDIVAAPAQRNFMGSGPQRREALLPSLTGIDIDTMINHNVFRGQTKHGRVVVKVTKRYNVAAHQLLASATPQAAPALYSYELLYPGSEYKVIMMEDLTYKGYNLLTDHNFVGAMTECELGEVFRLVRCALDTLHSQTVPLVLGDVRECNTMVRVVRPEGVSITNPASVRGRVHVQLVDYDYSRTSQERWYDSHYNMGIDWPPELVAAARHRNTALLPLMSPGHDAHMLEAMRHRVVQ